RKAQKAGDQLPERIEESEREREYLLQLRLQAEQSDGFAAIEAIRQEFEEHNGGRNPVGEKNPQRGKKQQTRRVTPMIDDDGNLIYIGRSGRENDQVTFDIGGPNDTWLHARGVPGSHVIVRWVRPDNESEESIETAAALAAYYSGSRGSGTVEVDIAKRRDVRKIKGAGPGMVTYRNEYTIPVRPLSEVDLKQAGRLEK
ncbi:MAG TPA: NFACT RNA binding domain-containing protein, partial [Thermomicrobiales bacterium]|nr:NFACT RNA binding domain-containing protein [Thermomicrobiales bacterium]